MQVAEAEHLMMVTVQLLAGAALAALEMGI
jgi:hypothetical protein